MQIITALHWRNIDPAIIRSQRLAVNALGYGIEQIEADRLAHGAWINARLAEAPAEAVFLFLDIDCIPLTAEVVDRAFAAAGAGEIFGVAQTANHRPDWDFIYAAPSFLAVSKATWERLGRVDMLPDRQNDVGMALTRAARAKGVPVTTLMPTFVCRPLWRLGHRGVMGIGTVYDGAVFHLFQSRENKGFDWAFHYVAEQVAAGRPIDYLHLHRRMNTLSMTLSHWRVALNRLRRRLGRSITKRLKIWPAPGR